MSHISAPAWTYLNGHTHGKLYQVRYPLAAYCRTGGSVCALNEGAWNILDHVGACAELSSVDMNEGP